MNNIALYELYQAAKRARPAKSSETIQWSNSFILDLTNKEGLLGDIDINDIPRDVRKGNVKKFLDKIQNVIIQMNAGFSRKPSLGSHYYECQKLLLCAEILHTLLFRSAALFVAEELVNKSKKYYFLNLTFQAYRIIYTIKARMNDTRGELYATEEFVKYLKYYEIEKFVEIYYHKIFGLYKKSSTYSTEMLNECNKALEIYGKYENKIPSYYFHFFYYNILYVKYTIEKNNEEVFRTAQTALTWFENLEFDYTPGKLTFTYIQLLYTIQKKEFAIGLSLIAKAQNYISKKSINWFKLKENELLLYCHSGDFDKAVISFFDAVSNKSFVSVNLFDKQRWLLYEAYVNLILETKSATTDMRRKRFSIQKFINELPQFSKDKRSMNIPILIAQMLFFIVRKQYNRAIDRIEALDKYNSRYLRSDETFRSNCFIKMLLEIPKNSFNRLRVERAAQKYFERLLDSEIDLIDQPFEIEIIPYERLWAMIMNHLRPDHHYAPKTPRTPILN